MAEERYVTADKSAKVLPLRPREPAAREPAVREPAVREPAVREPLMRDGLGRVLRRLRQEQGRTLDEVGAEARVSMPYLSEIERGRKEASSEVLAALCGALDITSSTLLILTGRELAGASAIRRVSRGPAPVTMMAA